jgi:hypothetical protein
MQHDDHVWVTVRGEAWAIRNIKRPYPDVMIFKLWRGHEPNLQFSWVILNDPDWRNYCEAAAALLERNRC